MPQKADTVTQSPEHYVYSQIDKDDGHDDIFFHEDPNSAGIISPPCHIAGTDAGEIETFLDDTAPVAKLLSKVEISDVTTEDNRVMFTSAPIPSIHPSNIARDK